MTKVRPLLMHQMTHYYWSCSVLIIYTNQIWTSARLPDISEVFIFRSEWATCWRWHEKCFHLQNTALHLKHAIWLVKIMTQYANTTLIQSSLEHEQYSENSGLTLVRLILKPLLNNTKLWNGGYLIIQIYSIKSQKNHKIMKENKHAKHG